MQAGAGPTPALQVDQGAAAYISNLCRSLATARTCQPAWRPHSCGGGASGDTKGGAASTPCRVEDDWERCRAAHSACPLVSQGRCTRHPHHTDCHRWSPPWLQR